MTHLTADAEHMLELALDKALEAIREGRREDAERTLTVATDAADLLQSEMETLE